jgi:hypothetical protein
MRNLQAFQNLALFHAGSRKIGIPLREVGMR